MKTQLLVVAVSIVLLSWPKAAAAQCSTYGGRATVVQANVLNIAPVVLSDTGNINSTGGVNDASLLNASVPGLLTAEVFSATAGGEGSFSQSVASMANLNLTVAGNTIGADFVMAHANASCGSGGLTDSGSAEIDGLVVNGQSIAVTGSPNQMVSLPGLLGGYIVLNEQSSSVDGSITVNAIHVMVPVVADAVISSAYAAVSGQLIGIGSSGGPVLFVGLLLQLPFAGTGGGGGGTCTDFFTGGGWITGTPSGDKGNFGVSGGVNPGGHAMGHLEYVDHGTGMNVHGTNTPICTATSATSREITGTANVSFPSGGKCTTGSYIVDVSDDDSSGTDTFAISVSGCGPAYTAGEPAGSTNLGGGDIEIHK